MNVIGNILEQNGFARGSSSCKRKGVYTRSETQFELTQTPEGWVTCTLTIDGRTDTKTVKTLRQFWDAFKHVVEIKTLRLAWSAYLQATPIEESRRHVEEWLQKSDC